MLEERRHQADMLQVYKIISGRDRIDREKIFKFVNNSGIVTRGVDDPLNLVQGRSRLDLRKNFFTQRIVASWNKVPAAIKESRTPGAFKRAYKNFRIGTC